MGNTYSNCLRIAVIRGYAHYGLDANEYVAKEGSRRNYPEEIVIEPDCNLPDLPPQQTMEDDIVNLEGTPVTAEPSVVNNPRYNFSINITYCSNSMIDSYLLK